MSARSAIPSRLLAVALAAGAWFIPAAVRAQAPVRGAFVVTLGSDTETVEQFTRDGNTVTGDILTRQPTAVVTHYTLTLGPDGMPARMQFTRKQGDGSPLPAGVQSGSMTFGPDTVASELNAGMTVTRKTPATHALPYLPHAFSFYQYAIDAMRSARADSMDIAMVPAGSRQPYPFPFVRRGADAYTVYFFDDARYPQTVTLDGSGAIAMVDGRRTTEKVVSRRVAGLDFDKLASAFAAGDRAGHALGIESPRDTVTATVGGAHLWVDYSRPAARGRTVFGASGVLGDTLWRTGANAATQFRTDADLDIAGHTLPAGTYTLWTSAHPGHSGLIFNKQTGQWGTDHDAGQDLFMVPLAERGLPAVVERFTIAIDAAGGKTGTLKLSWDRTELSIPFRVK